MSEDGQADRDYWNTKYSGTCSRQVMEYYMAGDDWCCVLCNSSLEDDDEDCEGDDCIV